MITLAPEASAVIKHYPVKMVSYTTYEQIFIHNETTGEMTMTSYGMSVTSHKQFFPLVKELFTKRLNLGPDGKKKEEVPA